MADALATLGSQIAALIVREIHDRKPIESMPAAQLNERPVEASERGATEVDDPAGHRQRIDKLNSSKVRRERATVTS